MKVLVIPDIHLKKWIFDKAESMLNEGKADRAVCLMDIPDDWYMDFNTELYGDVFDRAIEFAKTYPDTLWCYGNHDVSYPWGRLETGYSPCAESIVISKLEELEETIQDSSKIAIIHRIDNVLFSHGGLCEEYVKWLDSQLNYEENLQTNYFEKNIDEIIMIINNTIQDNLWKSISPLWLRPQHGDIEAYRRDKYMQVVGHTPVEEIYEKNGFISTDVFSTYRDGRQIGESAFLVINSITREYEKLIF